MKFSGERYIPGQAFGEIEIEHVHRYQAIKELVKDKIVLDAACGEGYGSYMLSQTAKHVIGIDISEESVCWAQDHYKSDNLDFKISTIEKLPLADASVDVVVSFETIEHVPEGVQEAFLRETRRVLRPDGTLVVSTPDKLLYSDKRNFQNQYHVREFYEREFVLFLQRWFENVEVFKQGFQPTCILSQVTERGSEPVLLRTIGPELPDARMYMVAICGNVGGFNLKQLESVIIMDQPSITYCSSLYVDVGEGFTDSVVVRTIVELQGNTFTASFEDLDKIGGEILGLMWVPTDIPFVKVNVSSIQTDIKDITIIPHSNSNSINGYDVFENFNPKYKIFGGVNSMSFLRIRGTLTKVSDEEVYRVMEGKYGRLKSEFHELQGFSVRLEEMNARYLRELESGIKLLQDNLRDSLGRLQNELPNAISTSLEQNLERNYGRYQHKIDSIESTFKAQVENHAQQMKMLSQAKCDLEVSCERLKTDLDLANATLQEVIMSTSWRLTAPFRTGGRLLRKMYKTGMRGGAKMLIRGIYRFLPGSRQFKVSAKDFVYRTFRFALKGTGMYVEWERSKTRAYVGHAVPELRLVDLGMGKEAKDYSVAIHVHLFYLDLIGEFIEYLSHVPVPFDLFVSTPNAGGKKAFLDILETKFIGKAHQVTVEVVPNRGRDVAPLVVTFGTRLLQYDYICHLHTKKSLYTGSTQDGWRNHLLSNLVGSEEIVEKNLAILEGNQRVGILYPETYKSLPYWAHAWLGSVGPATQLLNKIGATMPSGTYVDFPAGTMFWAKRAAIEPLFSLGLSYDDFPPENGQIDGTLAHAIERSIVQVARSRGMTLAEVNHVTGSYRFDIGTRNLWQYYSMGRSDLQRMIDDADVISFDIFDTLITRWLLEPKFVYTMVQKRIQSVLGLELPFELMRIEAENRVRSRLESNRDCNMSDIYHEFAMISGLSMSTCTKIRALEIEVETTLCLPREDVVWFFNYALKKNKQVILVSDMYMESHEIRQILDKCRINGYHGLWVSSETGKRKDSGAVWELYKQTFQNQRTLHIGDNEHSDIQHPCDRSLTSWHTMSGLNLFYNTAMGEFLKSRVSNLALGDAALLGAVVGREFNSPFAPVDYVFGYKIRDYQTLGRVIYGPIILRFTIWLFEKLEKHSIGQVLFLAREGYFLKQCFDRMNSYLRNADNPSRFESHYFMTSRRAVSVPTLETESDLFEVLDSNYEGTLGNLLSSRYGVEILESPYPLNETVKLPRDVEKVKSAVHFHRSVILENAQQERQAYWAYCESIGLTEKNDIAVVDLGYSGTIQYFLSKFLGCSTRGFYFVTSPSRKAERFPGNSMDACFDLEDGTHGDSIHKYSLLLEAVLTAPDGQLIRFKQSGEGSLHPVYGEIGYGQRNFTILDDVHKGILDYIDQVLKVYGTTLLNFEYTKDVYHAWYAQTVENKALLTDELTEFLRVEDQYCSDGELCVFDFYQTVYGG